MTVVAPGIAEQTRPGHFVAVQVGGPELEHAAAPGLRHLRRQGSAGSTAAPSRSSSPCTARAPRGWPGAGPQDPARRRRPARQALPAARDPVTATLVGGGYGTAPLLPLAAALRERGCRVDFVLGAASADRLFGSSRPSGSPLARGHHRRRLARASAAGSATCCRHVLDAHRRRRRLRLRADGDAARGVRARPPRRGIPCQVAVEESMACGIGVCMTCVLPVVGDDGADPDGALLRRGPGVPRRPGALGRRRHRAGRRRRRAASTGEAHR